MSDVILLSNLRTPSSRILQALDNASLHTVDLLTLDPFEIHRRTQISIIDVQLLVKDVIAALTQSVEKDVKTALERGREVGFLTTGDRKVDELLGGGIPTAALTEITGESGMGKSQFCLQLCVQVQLPRSLGGLDSGAIYMSTESALPTTRLSQIASSLISTLSISPPPQTPADDIDRAIETLESHGDRIYYYNCSDLEAQEHIVKYQLPVVLSRYNIGLIILDSVTANYRAEFDRPNSSQASQMATRSKDLRRLAGTLKDLAIEHNVAVVAVNQVTDTFKRQSQSSQEEELLTLDYQGKWFDGLVDEFGEGTKRPALGLVWTNLITTRIMFVRDLMQTRTRMKVVFSPYAKPGSLVYTISTERGVHAVEPVDFDKKREEAVDLEGIEFSDIDVEELWSEPSQNV